MPTKETKGLVYSTLKLWSLASVAITYWDNKSAIDHHQVHGKINRRKTYI